MSQSDSFVYLFIDTTDVSGPGQGAFYVGKGTGGRLLDHLDEAAFIQRELAAETAALVEEKSSRKAARIAELLQRPGSLRIDILRRDLTEDEALRIESAAIDLLGIDNLTNRISGHGSQRTPLRAFHLRAKAQDVPLTDPAIIVGVSGIWAPGDRLEGLSGLDDPEVWENAHHQWRVKDDVRGIIRRLANSAEPVRLLAVHLERLGDGTRTMLGGIVMGEWFISDTQDTSLDRVEFTRSSRDCPPKYLFQRLRTADGSAPMTAQSGVRYSYALNALR